MKTRILFPSFAAASLTGVVCLLATGCASLNPFKSSTPPPLPVVATVEAAPPPLPALKFSAVGDAPISDRSSIAAQIAVAETNRAWSVRATERAAYLRNARLLNAALESDEFNTREEEIRLATMSLQCALLADDRDAMKIAVRHWEAGFNGIRSAPNAGEIETYLMAARRLGHELPETLVKIAHPEIQAVLGIDQ